MGRVVDFPEGRRMDHHAIRPTEPAHIIILPVVRIESVHRDQVAQARRRRHRMTGANAHTFVIDEAEFFKP